MLLRIVKYFVLIVSEPIVRVTLNVLCRLQGFRITRVNNWVFRGPPDFIRLVNEAEKRLRSEDSDLLKATAGHCTVQEEHLLFSHGNMPGFPATFLRGAAKALWQLGCISPTSGNPRGKAGGFLPMCEGHCTRVGR